MEREAAWYHMLVVTIPGKPEPAGSKRAFIIRSKAGAQRAVVTDANKNAGAWKDKVSLFLAQTVTWIGSGPVRVDFVFTLPRPRGHYRTGKHAGELRKDAPTWPTSRPDALKLARAAEDAMTGTVFGDDAQIVEEHIHKVYGPAPGSVRIDVWVWRTSPYVSEEEREDLRRPAVDAEEGRRGSG